MLLGGELKRKERLSARLGDVLSYLYLGSAALKRYHDLGNPDYLHPLLRWAMEENLGKAEAALEDLLNNFPSRFFGCALKVLVLPFGRRHKGPGDELDAEIAEILGRPDDDLALQAISPARSCRKTRRTGRCPRPRLRRGTRKRRAGENPAQGDRGRQGPAASGAEPDRCRRRRRRAERRAGAGPAPGRSGTAQGDRRRRLRQGGTATGRRQDPLTLRGKATVATDKGAFRRLCRLLPTQTQGLARIDGHIPDVDREAIKPATATGLAASFSSRPPAQAAPACAPTYGSRTTAAGGARAGEQRQRQLQEQRQRFDEQRLNCSRILERQQQNLQRQRQQRQMQDNLMIRQQQLDQQRWLLKRIAALDSETPGNWKTAGAKPSRRSR